VIRVRAPAAAGFEAVAHRVTAMGTCVTSAVYAGEKSLLGVLDTAVLTDATIAERGELLLQARTPP